MRKNIIELVDVVEEPESRMSIDSFVPTGREKSLGEVTPLDSWGKLEFEQKPVERDLEPRPEKKIGGMDLRFKRKVPLKEAAPEEELFDKIELEEILEKVEQLKPSLEKEWPSGKEVRDIERKTLRDGGACRETGSFRIRKSASARGKSCGTPGRTSALSYGGT